VVNASGKKGPKEFGKDNANFPNHYVLFLAGERPKLAMKEIDVPQGIDTAWRETCRLPTLTSRAATRSHPGQVGWKPVYRSITMRT
jgi:hypothetical protein